jgi:hypothetical protein
MPKQKTDDLIQLIKSLTRAEKRHFRLFVRRNQASDNILFLQLFDFLDKYKDYDEQLILKKLPAIKKRQLSNLKAHLYKQLLISLRLLNKNHNHDIQIREQIDYARLLYNKSLYRQSLDVLDKAKQRAFKTKNNSIALEIVEFEKHIEGQYITRSIEGRAEELTQENNFLTKAIVQSNQFSNLSLQLYGHYLKNGYARGEKDYQKTKAFLEENLPEDISYDELGFLGKIYYCQSFVWYYLITQEFLPCYRHAQRWVDLFNKEPELKELYAPLYLKGMHNLLNALFHILYYDRFVEVLQQLEDFKEIITAQSVVNNEGLFHLYKYIHTIQKHYLEGSFTEGVQHIDELVRIIDAEKYNWDERRIMVFYYRIACLYFGSGDNDNAIHYLNLIINQKNPDYRGDIQCFSRILNLIAHFDLGNAQLVEYQVKSVYRFLSKMQDLGKVQREIFRFLRRTPKMQESEMKKEFQELKDKLHDVETAQFERRPFLYLDIISWLESKIEERPIQDIIREKFLKRKANFRQ